MIKEKLEENLEFIENPTAEYLTGVLLKRDKRIKEQDDELSLLHSKVEGKVEGKVEKVEKKVEKDKFLCPECGGNVVERKDGTIVCPRCNILLEEDDE